MSWRDLRDNPEERARVRQKWIQWHRTRLIDAIIAATYAPFVKETS